MKPTALQRFLAKCAFNPQTGCVTWTGGTTCGHGKNQRYGSFWFEGKRWTAHRWSAKHIHGLEINGLDVDHTCGNTLCQHHLQAIPGSENTKWYWIRVEKGVFEYEPPHAVDDAGIPFYWPPAYLSAALT